MLQEELKFLEKFALEARRLTVQQVGSIGMGHIGGSLSMIELLTVLYNKFMNVDPKNPKMEGRDRLVLSKGHCGPGLYTVLAQKGFFPIEELFTLNKPGTILPSHCDMVKTPGIDMSTGSLGQGYSCAVGMAKGSKILKDNATIYAIVGDGECQEGQIWEAAMTANHYKLDNLITFVDCNKGQVDGYVEDVMKIHNLKQVWEGFGYQVLEVDGHNMITIYDAIEIAKNTKGKPTVIFLDTVKGKGISIFEKMGPDCHHIPVTKEQVEEALKEL
jgi:transketolase